MIHCALCACFLIYLQNKVVSCGLEELAQTMLEFY